MVVRHLFSLCYISAIVYPYNPILYCAYIVDGEISYMGGGVTCDYPSE